MDELVHDLTNALESSGCGPFTFPDAGASADAGGAAFGRKAHRKRRGRNKKDLEESAQIATEDLAKKLQLQNLSDNNSDTGCLQVVCSRETVEDISNLHALNLVESDSVNENFSPVRPHRRRRKFKRMAIDPSVPREEALSPTHTVQAVIRNNGFRSSCKGHQRHSRGETTVVDCLPAHPHGKRKRNLRERSVDVAETDPTAPCASSPSSSAVLMSCCDNPLDEEAQDHRLGAGDVIMETSSSSLASSDSDVGLYTNDEGREGDDEQSDFYHEAGPTCGVPDVPCWWPSDRLGLVDELPETDAAFRAILTSGFRYLSYESQRRIGAKLPNLPGREIRAGRRRLRDRRPGFSIKTSVNEKISKFLQDPEQNELRLHPMKRKEIDQLGHLASLYSLNLTDEGTSRKTCPVLTKTSNTMQAVKMDNPDVVRGLSTVGDIKRLRRTPPSSPVEGNLSQDRPDAVS